MLPLTKCIIQHLNYLCVTRMKLFIIIATVMLIGCASYTYRPIMSGDCVDRAVIIRQDLKAKGYEAELVLGLRGEKEGHCWVKYKDKKTGEWVEIKNY